MILFRFVEVVATDRIAVLMPILDAQEDCPKCSALESDITWIQGQRERENNALMDTILAYQKSLSDVVATNKSEKQAWEKQQQQQLEEMERERQAREQEQQQRLEEMQNRFAAVEEALQGERQAREQLEESVRELRSDVDALVQLSDIHVLNMAAKVLKRFLKKQSNVGASWSASSIFAEHEKDIVRTSLREFGVTYDVERFAELSALLLNARHSAIHCAEDGDDLPGLAQEVVQALASRSPSRALNSTVAFALDVLTMSGGLLSRV